MTPELDVDEAVARIRGRVPDVAPVALVLGSGLRGLADELANPVDVPFTELPGFPAPGVEGHAGFFRWGVLGGAPLLVQSGRYHLYEGHDSDLVGAPIRVMSALGVRIVVFTNAAGGADPALEPGELVLLDDHIDLLFRSPLAGPTRAGESRFPDMSAPWDPHLQERALACASELGLALHRGVYAAVTGPSYETPAEVRMLRTLGADVIGMSTVPEALVARASGVRCLGFSMVTNKGAGYATTLLDHDEVVRVGQETGRRLARLLRALVPQLASSVSTSTK